jgi:hypothetical protein
VSNDDRVWRAPLVFRVFFGLFSVACAAGALWPWEDLAGYWHDLGTRLALLAVGAFWVCLTYRARMEIRDHGLVLRYTLTTRVIPLHAIASVSPERSRLIFTTRDGGSYNSPAFIGEKAPLLMWLRRRTRADGIADTILAARPSS